MSSKPVDSISKRSSSGVPSSSSSSSSSSSTSSAARRASGGVTSTVTKTTSKTPSTTTTTSTTKPTTTGVKRTSTTTVSTPTGSSVTKGLSSLKVSEKRASGTASSSSASASTSTPTSAAAKSSSGSASTPSNSESRRASGTTISRRRGDDDDKDPPAPSSTTTSSTSAAAPTPTPASSSSSSATSDSATNATTAAAAAKARRRLSITANKSDEVSKVDGSLQEESKDPMSKVLKSMAAIASSSSKTPTSGSKRRAFSHFQSLSKVGYVPFNANKVNQDRCVEIAKFGNSEEKAFFGVFDGHGALGHEVSSFLISELPKFFLKQPNLDTQPHEAISKSFVDCNSKLGTSAIDCTFSGSTGIVVYLTNGKMYSCNAGDSRAVLAQAKLNAGTGELKYTAVPLSDDQKPERPDEKKRIIESKGRVEACKGLRGEDIGPPRVWLSHQDVPGLAMSRSFGDLIAASVGVIAKPEIWEREYNPDVDKFMILASDGVWEFISNQEAVDIVVSCSNPEEAVKALVDEATKRWHAEEEVVDDITACIVWF